MRLGMSENMIKRRWGGRLCMEDSETTPAVKVQELKVGKRRRKEFI